MALAKTLLPFLLFTSVIASDDFLHDDISTTTNPPKNNPLRNPKPRKVPKALSQGTQADEVALNSLFNTLDYKPTPLYYCRSWLSGINWKIPSRLPCPLAPTSEASTVVELTIFFENISVQSQPAYECFAETTTTSRTWYFFGSEQEKFSKEKVYISEAHCRDLIKSKTAPNGDKLERISDGFFGTSRKTEATWKWPQTDISTVVNYYFTILTMAVSSRDSAIQAPTKLLDNCLDKVPLSPP
jgi:hypothetical protein